MAEPTYSISLTQVELEALAKGIAGPDLVRAKSKLFDALDGIEISGVRELARELAGMLETAPRGTSSWERRRHALLTRYRIAKYGRQWDSR